MMKNTMNQDHLYRYTFEGMSVRGELVQLSQSFLQLVQGKAYPDQVKNLLGELMAATCLLTATIKFKGSITVQIQGDGPISLLVINGNHNQVMRGTARWNDKISNEKTLQELVGKGHIVITIEPKQGERYQGIIALEKATLAKCIEDYFLRSEQLNSRIWLRSEKNMAAGMLLQVIPDDQSDEKDFEHLVKLTETIKNEELFELKAKDILYRLYHQENVTLYPANIVTFQCTCSRERSILAISAIEKSELEAMLTENKTITLHCDYCGTDYHFDSADISLMTSQNIDPSSRQLH